MPRSMARGIPSRSPWRLLAVPAIFYLLVFVAPLTNLFRISLFRSVPGRFMEPVITGDAYLTLASDPYYWEVMLTTLRIGCQVTVMALVLGYPLAYFLARTRSRRRALLIALVLAPLLVSIVVRTYGWMVLLTRNGLVNTALLRLGLTDEPLSLIFNEIGVLIGLTHVLLPFMVLSIMSSLEVQDRALEDAAVSLGASSWHVFWRVTFPLSLSGIAAGCIVVFILAVGAFVTPTLLGGSVVTTIPILAYQQFQLSYDWPFGSALAVLLLITVLVTVALYSRLLRRWLTRGLVHEG